MRFAILLSILAAVSALPSPADPEVEERTLSETIDLLIRNAEAANAAHAMSPAGLVERGVTAGQRCPAGQTAKSNGVAATPNGCGTTKVNVPDFGWKDCCNNHDRCYANCSKVKKTCDSEFLTCMVGWCTNKYKAINPMRAICVDGAGIYYGAVAAVGLPAFNSATKKHCVCK